jgi:hypothetical protein
MSIVVLSSCNSMAPAKSGMIFIVQVHKTKGLEAAQSRFSRWLQDLGHTTNRSLTCLNCYLYEITASRGFAMTNNPPVVDSTCSLARTVPLASDESQSELIHQTLRVSLAWLSSIEESVSWLRLCHVGTQYTTLGVIKSQYISSRMAITL